MSLEAYGVAYMSPIFIENLISPRKYNPVKLLSDSQSVVKATVQEAVRKNQKLPVVIAGSLDVLQVYLRSFPDLPCKVILCDMPPALTPCVGPKMKWLDCDQQQGGAWQVAKLMIEDLDDQLELLSPLSNEGRAFLTGMKRLQSDDRMAQLKSFAEKMPKSYTDLVSSLDKEQNKSPLKTVKEARKTKETLRSLLAGTLDTVVNDKHKEDLARLVLDYELSLVGKRDYLSKINLVITDDTIKKDFLTLRKWMDSKSGALLQEAFLDYASNKERRSWQTVVDSYKKVSEEDLLMLITHFDVSKAQVTFEEKLLTYKALPGDKQAPKAPNRPAVSTLADLLNL